MKKTAVANVQAKAKKFTHTQLKCKCLMCNLHFIICTEHPERHSQHTVHCPECGKHDKGMVLWGEKKAGFIFETVPGNAGLIGVLMPGPRPENN